MIVLRTPLATTVTHYMTSVKYKESGRQLSALAEGPILMLYGPSIHFSRTSHLWRNNEVVNMKQLYMKITDS